MEAKRRYTADEMMAFSKGEKPLPESLKAVVDILRANPSKGMRMAIELMIENAASSRSMNDDVRRDVISAAMHMHWLVAVRGSLEVALDALKTISANEDAMVVVATGIDSTNRLIHKHYDVFLNMAHLLRDDLYDKIKAAEAKSSGQRT